MPMSMPPSGGLPSPMTQASPNAGAATQQQGNRGNVQAAMVKVKSATELLESALPLIPMGSEEHEKLAKIIADLSKGLGKAAVSAQQKTSALQAEAQNVAKQAPMANMAQMFGANQGAGQPPAQAA